MFDANILYYAYDNLEGDDYNVGYIGNKQAWVDMMNRWNRNDANDEHYTIEDWDDMEFGVHFRGCVLAEVAPDEQSYVVTWAEKDNEKSVRIDRKGEVSWVNNSTKNTSVPRWINRLKTVLREHKKQ